MDLGRVEFTHGIVVVRVQVLAVGEEAWCNDLVVTELIHSRLAAERVESVVRGLVLRHQEFRVRLRG